MLEALVSFLGIAVLVSVTPGPATALVVRSAALHGRRESLHVVLGNSTGILMWALASVLGISALVAASETAFWVLKVVGAVVLVWLGGRAVVGRGGGGAGVRVWLGARALFGRGGAEGDADGGKAARSAYGSGLMTSFANPKLAV